MGYTNINIPTGNTKIPVGLSFSGLKGHMAFDVISNAKSYGFNKSELVVELLLLYGEARKNFGENALLHLQMASKRLDEK